MIVYKKTKKEFLKDVFEGEIESTILASLVRETGHSTGQSEQRSWRESMGYMGRIIQDEDIPEDVGVAIEYHIPQTTKRIDFVITGKSHTGQNSAVIIELKQWSTGVFLSDKDGVLETTFHGEVSHPSYQAWSYTALLEDYNSSIQDNNIFLKPCAYLHNYPNNGIIENNFYKEYLDKAPVFFKTDAQKLQDFIKEYVKWGDRGELLYIIDHGKIRPSKSLADSLSSMLDGNKEFLLIDNQKIVYETALDLAKKATEHDKKVLIIEGGPGTGKSVVAINLLAELTKRGMVTQYVTKNSAPRTVYQIKLSGKYSKTRISNLFTSSGSFCDADPNIFDVLLIDEAHRLNEKSGLFSNKGENQIKELIHASKLSVFFIDEDQTVTLKDIGKVIEIEKWANFYSAQITKMELESQFRCSGSDGYLSWLDNSLGIRETANEDLQDVDYDFQVFDNINKLHEDIKVLNQKDNKARLVAGYCWDWISKKNLLQYDFVIDGYRAKWNLSSHGQSWIVHPESVEEIGCIHTCQGLDLDYVGVIVGPDFIVRNGKIITDYKKRAKTDQSLKGLKSLIKKDGSSAISLADRIIKNTYKTLMTRGMKGCYVYCTDPETQEYFMKVSKKEVDSAYQANTDGSSINTDI